MWQYHGKVQDLRYAGVIQFVFVVLHLQFIKFTFVNLCCISKDMMKQQQQSKTNLHLFSYAYCKCNFVDSLIEYLSPPKWKRTPIFFKHVYVVVIIHISSPIHTPLKYRVPINKK